MFGNSNNVSPEPPALFGAKPEHVATNEAALPVPWFAGTRWLGVTWMGDAWGVATTEVKAKVGKKKQVVGYNYYANVCALVSGGPVDKLISLKFDDAIAWTGPIGRVDEDGRTIMVDGRGAIHVQWGTETQPLNALLSASGLRFTPMRGQFVLIGEQLFFGQDRTNAPNIRVQAYRAAWPSWMPETTAKIGESVNPIAVLWEWWTDHRFGMHRGELELDEASLLTAAATLKLEGIGISPFIDRDMDFRAALTKLTECCDGYPVVVDGRLGFALNRTPAGSVPVLLDTNMLSDPVWTPGTWETTYDSIRLKYPATDQEGNETSVTRHNIAAFSMLGRHRPLNLERPWIVDATVAAKLAAAEAAWRGVPQNSVSFTIPESSATMLELGDVFALDTRDGTRVLFRVEERSGPAPGTSTISIKAQEDRGWAYEEPDAGAPVGDDAQDQTVFEPQVAYDVRILDAPYAFGVPERATLNYMVARGDGYSTEFDVWRSKPIFVDYQSAAATRSGALFAGWAIRAELTAAYSAATLPVDQWVGIAFDVLGPDQAALDDEFDFDAGMNHEIVAFFGPTATEIMSLWDVVKTGAASYTAKTVRGLYDTRRRDHADGTEVWIQLRTKVVQHAWPPFTFDLQNFKVQPTFGAGQVALADITPEPHEENGRTLRAIAPPNVRVGGDNGGDAFGAVWDNAGDAIVYWENTSRAATVFGQDIGEAPPTDLTAVRLELWTYDGLTFVDQVDMYPGNFAIGWRLYNSWLVGRVTDFSVRCYGMRGSWKSLDYTEVKVTMI